MTRWMMVVALALVGCGSDPEGLGGPLGSVPELDSGPALDAAPEVSLIDTVLHGEDWDPYEGTEPGDLWGRCVDYCRTLNFRLPELRPFVDGEPRPDMICAPTDPGEMLGYLEDLRTSSESWWNYTGPLETHCTFQCKLTLGGLDYEDRKALCESMGGECTYQYGSAPGVKELCKLKGL